MAGPQENGGLGNDAGVVQEKSLKACYERLMPCWELPWVGCECHCGTQRTTEHQNMIRAESWIWYIEHGTF